ncbi:N4-gp56 family major capsid protein [Clostridium botulinum]|uniref:N4-gp56 family major capsid protein n=1 Tax=Clostridium botulinum TaxID=1491 RepID=UPI000773649A|nr:N4-gp56 family major capsid protein [Clostridium botulinum]NFH81728.1 N4-gp56 family major capsid protein [Clostridium botulinum]NFH84961.1 N4-gp56 family major capsid protein [Clostridium botulinum]NFI12967.1 N4-gp56 family major capsid protein [Clostridium botulinum]NFI16165.1 N4-gp56 family major capsid protein [Clostridium botulinum]NFO85968.1 N4-gp56 family major capsid protein [Clostridium botulinum]
MSNLTTKLQDLINPEVMADMISAKIPKKIVVAPFAKLDTKLSGQPGDTVTVPQYSYIGDAVDVAEGIAAETVKLSASTTKVTIKKAMKAVELTDEAVLSGYGNPVGESNNQIAKAMAAKVDNDCMDALYNAQLFYDGSSAAISYNSVVDAIDVFNEEVNTGKVMFVHPKQVTKLRKDSNFISADKYGAGTNVMMVGEIGSICNTRIVPSKKVKDFDTWYSPCESGTSGGLKIVATGASTNQVNLADVTPSLPNAKVDEYVTKSTTGVYFNPIVKLQNDLESEDDAPALTIYLKRDTNVETDRVSLARKTDISADKHYAAALSNNSKVVIAKIKQ